MTHGTKFGELPFEKVMMAEFDLRGLESMKHAAHLQYKLLLLDPVVRAHVDFPKKSMRIDYLDPNKTTEKILETIKPVRATLKSRRIGEYDELVYKSYHEGGWKGSE